jgi:hypothetical protein
MNKNNIMKDSGNAVGAHIDTSTNKEKIEAQN